MKAKPSETGYQPEISPLNDHGLLQRSTDSKRRYFQELISPAPYYIFQALLIALVLAEQFRLFKRDLNVPINFRGDTTYFLVIIKAIAREGWWWHVNSLSAPGGLDLVSIPILGNLDALLLKLLATFSKQPGLLINLYWIGTVLVAGSLSMWCLRRLGMDRRVAFALGTLYALSPHIYYRNTAHLMLAHHLIPPVATLSILLATGGKFPTKRTLYALLVTCALIGFSYTYYAFFSCLVLFVGGVVGFFRGRELRVVYLTAAAVGIVLVATALNLLPPILTWRADPAARAFTFKSPAEADIYGLKVRQLITPMPRSPIPLLASLREKIEAAHFPLTEANESNLSRMGAVASFGFLGLLAVSVFLIGAPVTPNTEVLKAAATLTLGCILFGSVGGFGSLFNVLVRPDIRCYNRISIFIVFYSLTAVAVFMTKMISLVPSNSLTKTGIALGLAAVAFVGIVDQNEAYTLNVFRDEDAKKFYVLSDFVGRIESDLPAGSFVYQLPPIGYTDAEKSIPFNPRVPSNAHEEPFLFSSSVRWSWPATSDDATAFAQKADLMGPSVLVEALRRHGFQALYIDRLAYADGRGDLLIKGLSDHLRRPPLQSADQRYAFFNLVSSANSNSEPQYDWGQPILFQPDGGNAFAHLGEGWSCVGCTEGRSVTMYFDIKPPNSDVRLRAHVAPALFGDIKDRPVQVLVNDIAVGEWHVRQTDWYELSIPRELLEKQSRLVIRFDLPNAASPQSLGVNGDTRVLSVTFDQMMLLTKAGNASSVR